MQSDNTSAAHPFSHHLHRHPHEDARPPLPHWAFFAIILGQTGVVKLARIVIVILALFFTDTIQIFFHHQRNAQKHGGKDDRVPNIVGNPNLLIGLSQNFWNSPCAKLLMMGTLGAPTIHRQEELAHRLVTPPFQITIIETRADAFVQVAGTHAQRRGDLLERRRRGSGQKGGGRKVTRRRVKRDGAIGGIEQIGAVFGETTRQTLLDLQVRIGGDNLPPLFQEATPRMSFDKEIISQSEEKLGEIVEGRDAASGQLLLLLVLFPGRRLLGGHRRGARQRSDHDVQGIFSRLLRCCGDVATGQVVPAAAIPALRRRGTGDGNFSVQGIFRRLHR
mmetsp:Transcript_23893/g.39090  ORF Transcript_23893/g.39090 Transcript_23893/m.39090 type:complete len:334 (+) Transcript_23893:59-1060(+)